ncbi:iron ABC transporter permease [Butyrivibrio sp. XB500-5]|uniref:FecCD family ABC transporter permease n=1 Tax=Butyrivibrio sp. XB500-5 TaxID=2364880 RepID=UPI000EAA4C01|nr:iron ABC transporter permease [Butyrivibrio sp. XB500-5]RKM63319.1 iron ABC transporter permease [Butyrivibrio sp. XB500-5]
MKKNRFIIIGILMLFIIVVSFIFAMSVGTAGVTWLDTYHIIVNKLFGLYEGATEDVMVKIIWDLRFPRAILAVAVGGGLAVAGVAMQAITQNVLAEPYILGVSSGASATVTGVYFFAASLVYVSFVIPIFAFAGAMLSMIMVYKIGMTGRNNNRLVLAGMTVSVILNAVSQFFISMMDSNSAIRSVTMWMMGSLAGARWNNLLIPCVGVVIGFVYLFLNARAYNAMSLGDETAISLGIDARQIKKRTIIAVSFITGIIVSAAGLVGFVGFIIPHIVRSIIGSDHRKTLPICFIGGGIFLLWMDILARTIMAPQEMAIGIFTAFCGGPFFAWLLYRKNGGKM